MPLDRLSLEDRSSDSTHEITGVRFGPNEIVRLHRNDVSRRVPVEALARFGARYQFPTTELDGFCWLVTSRTEQAGPLERRTWLDVLNTSLAEVDTVGLFRSTYPTPGLRRSDTMGFASPRGNRPGAKGNGPRRDSARARIPNGRNSARNGNPAPKPPLPGDLCSGFALA